MGGVFFSIFLYKKSKGKIRLIFLVSWVIPVAIYFAIHPIYQGDFSNSFRTISIKTQNLNIVSDELVVITIPGCPFCFESIAGLKQLKNKNKSLKIRFIVCSSDKHTLLPYQREINNSFELQLANNPTKIAEIAQGKFPSFLFKKQNKIQIWSNDSFIIQCLNLINSKIENNLKDCSENSSFTF